MARPGPPEGAAAASTPDSLDQLAHSIRHGAPGPDAIPSIDHPPFVPAAQARFLAEEDVVFGLVRAGQTRAYPQLVLVWHEIVNDRFPDGPLSVTYCPLTGSVLAFRGAAPDGEPYTFGTSGDLVNSNLLMYDRQTNSRWPQLLGQAILGPSRARRAAAAVAAAYLLVYLLAVGDVTVSPASDLSRFVDLSSLQVAPDWTAKLLQRRAAFAYEPVLGLYPVNHVTVFVAPLDLAMGLLLGGLAGLNLAVALLARRASRACRLRGLPGCSAPCRRCLPGSPAAFPRWRLARSSPWRCLRSAIGCSPSPWP